MAAEDMLSEAPNLAAIEHLESCQYGISESIKDRNVMLRAVAHALQPSSIFQVSHVNAIVLPGVWGRRFVGALFQATTLDIKRQKLRRLCDSNTRSRRKCLTSVMDQ